MAGSPQFEKFDELLVYIAEKSADDEKFGDMKLNKLLYFADIEAYRRLGHTITRTRYQHLEHGPGSVSLKRARENLMQEGVLEVGRRRFFQFWQTVTKAKRPARREVFDQDELEIVDLILKRYENYNGSEMADLSHREPGWKMTSEGEDIAVETSLLTPHASPASIERGKELAQKLGW